jgi:hypothetical protein
MNAPDKYQIAKTEEAENVAAGLQSIGVSIGTFAGTSDRIIRIRNGQIVPADTGDQGGGQN